MFSVGIACLVATVVLACLAGARGRLRTAEGPMIAGYMGSVGIMAASALPPVAIGVAGLAVFIAIGALLVIAFGKERP